MCMHLHLFHNTHEHDHNYYVYTLFEIIVFWHNLYVDASFVITDDDLLRDIWQFLYVRPAHIPPGHVMNTKYCTDTITFAQSDDGHCVYGMTTIITGVYTMHFSSSL